MKIRTKKKNSDGIVKLETSGNLKEVIINENFLKPKETTVALCFRGKSSSGIIELTPGEIEMINKEIAPQIRALEGVKVLKFDK